MGKLYVEDTNTPREYKERSTPFDNTLPLRVAGGMLFKYAELDAYLGDDIVPRIRTKGAYINLIIDIEPIIRSCTTKMFVQEHSLLAKEDRDLTIIYGIMKVVAHYRRYFNKKGLATRVFCYYSTSTSSHAYDIMDKVVGNCRIDKFPHEPFYSKLVMDDIGTALKKFDMICQHTPGVYLISTGNTYEVCMPHMLMNAQENSDEISVGGSFIISSDALIYQYASSAYKIHHDAVYVLTPRGRRVVTEDSLVDTYMSWAHKKAYEANKDKCFKLTPFYIHMNALFGVPKLGIPSCRAGRKDKVFDFLINELSDVPFDKINDKICEFLKTEPKQKQYLKNIQVCDASMMATKSTQSELAAINSQILDYTSVDVVRELTRLFSHHFESTAFVVGNFLRS